MMNSIFMIMNYHYCDSFCKSLIIIFMMMMQCFQYITMNQLNYCLIQSNECDHDDCCFNILPKTGPICDPIPGCAAYFQPECCRNTRPVHTDYGIMYGYAISLDNEYGYQENSKRYIQIWKGIPYAHPPTQKNNLRFHRPIPPMYSTEKYDATYFRPFGYLATYSSYSENNKNINDYDNDDELKGNYGLWDQIRALEFIKEHAEKFLGDPNQITVIGHGSAAADIALHLLSEKSGRRKPPLFHRVGCDVSSKRSMIKCLRSRTAIELSNAASKTRIHRPNWLTKPWAPTLDYDFIMNTPDYLWTNGFYAHIPLIGGMVVDDGVFHALASIYELDIPLKHWNLLNTTQEYSVNSQLPNPNNEFSGITYDIMRSGFMEMVKNDFALDPISVTNSLLFQYTYWPNRNNSLSQWKMYRSAWTDRLIGSGLIKTLNYHSNQKFINNQLYKSITNQFIPMNLTRMYVFNYKSINDKWSQLIGIYPGSELQYLFGLPLLQLYKTIDEINQQWLIDLTNNQCQIEYQLKQNYKLHEYAYWNYAYWKQLLWLPRYATVMTISMNLTNDYQVYIVFILIGLLVIVYLIIMLLLITKKNVNYLKYTTLLECSRVERYT
ncbi:Acetylcholinesterase [Schistosoma japonicum]|nr:Acetylcholinesterase [Schistosoma japonicum]